MEPLRCSGHWTIFETVVNFDIRPPKILKHQPFWKYVDIRDKEQFTSALEALRPTYILHLAAMTGMDIGRYVVF